MAILQSAYRIFEAPVVLTNERYRLIAQWPREPIGDMVFDGLLEGPSLSMEIVQRYVQEYLYDKETTFSPFFVDHGVGGAYPRILGQVSVRSAASIETLGHFGILLGEKELQSWHLEAADILAKVLAVFLSSRGMMGVNAVSSANILYDLLDPALLSSDFEILKRDFLNDFPLPWQILFVDLAAGTELKTFAPVIVSNLSQRFPNLAILHESHELIILSGSNGSRKASVERRRVEQLSTGRRNQSAQSDVESDCLAAAAILQTYGYGSILLPPIYVADKIRHVRSLARLTQDYVKYAGLDDDKLIRYEDLAGGPLYYYLVQHPAAPGMCHPVLDRLRLHDDENGTDYYRTLKTLCANNYHSGKAAADLHVHRNTLLYRIERMSELFGLDLSDVRLLPQLCISFRMHELLPGGMSLNNR